jgi:hypothetical protein
VKSRLSILAALLLVVTSATAQHMPMNPPGIRADISGSWFNPAQPGHGLMIEILDRQRAVVAWYTYDAAGEPLWLFGTGAIGGQEIVVELSAFSGGRPPDNWATGDPQGEPWGTARLQFHGCMSATLAWESVHPAFGTGELDLERLTWLQGERCNAEELYSLQVHHSFERRTQGFRAVFADLPENWEGADYELDFRRQLLPPPLSDYAGLRLTGHNRSDDLAMLVTAPIAGLQPGSLYRVEIEAEIASNVPRGCAGIGGSPGDGVYIKLGAAGEEPVADVDPVDGWLRLNIDYGVQSNPGVNARIAGTLANSQDCDNGPEGEWEIKRMTTQGQPLIISAGGDGVLWVFAGSDSAFEGFTQYYILSVTTRLEPYGAE